MRTKHKFRQQATSITENENSEVRRKRCIDVRNICYEPRNLMKR